LIKCIRSRSLKINVSFCELFFKKISNSFSIFFQLFFLFYCGHILEFFQIFISFQNKLRIFVFARM
jgi:hypothetical protein